MKRIKSKEIMAILDKNGIQYKFYKFRGSCHGTNESLPIPCGNYDTVREHNMDVFKIGSDNVGNWRKIYEFISEGCACEPDVYVSIYVQKTDWDKVQSLFPDTKFPFRRTIPRHEGSCAWVITTPERQEIASLFFVSISYSLIQLVPEI